MHCFRSRGEPFLKRFTVNFIQKTTPMRTILFSVSSLLLISATSLAQAPYTFSVYSQPYVPLDSATLVDSGYAWNSNDYLTAPVGFAFNIDTIHCPYMFSSGGSSFATDTNVVTISAFLFTSASLDDRGYMTDSVAHSPIRYKLTGPAGHRIFKFEIANAGFDQQLLDMGVMTDSVSLQSWFYEDSGIVELRYGPSHITGTDYFTPFNFAGYARDVDSNGNGLFYALGGNPLSPIVQHVPLVGGNPSVAFSGLTSFPPSGTVYRFAYHPGALAITQLTDESDISVYPTVAANEVTVQCAKAGGRSYEILSVSGIHMDLSGPLTDGRNEVDVRALPAGMYLLRVNGGAGSTVYKFVKM